ncbi:MAG: alpha/beta hydrolase [Parasporobacterium sp.]|nr:alpha/beta hydrolase [Parasporobacterium sp.]
MRCLTKEINFRGETATLSMFLIDPLSIAPNRIRPMILICPGGAYAYTSEREAEPVAQKFLGMGYHTAILYYTCNPGAARKEAEFPAALVQTALSVAFLRENSKEYHIDPERIILAGFSAGGHVALSLGVFWNRDFLKDLTNAEPRSCRPDALLLSYPVVTSGAFTHEESIHNLLGSRAEDAHWREFVSLEKQVSGDVPPTFLWTTGGDEGVPAENSLELALALRRFHVPTELHLYRRGPHGLSLANADVCPEAATVSSPYAEVRGWTELADTWLKTL